MNPYYNNTNFFDSVRIFFSRKSIFPQLILINVGVFVLVYLINLILWLFQLKTSSGMSIVTYWLAVPSSVEMLIIKPWTVVTYMFLHEGFFHLFFNMLILYFGGMIFLQYLNERQLLWTYLLGGLTGAFFYIVSYNFFPVFLESNPFAIALGASASVLAILVAMATYVPQYTVNLFLIGPVRLKYLAIFFIIVDIFSIQGSNPGGHIAHLGGAFWGFLYVFILKGGKDVLSFPEIFPRKRKMKTTYRNPAGKPERPLDDDEYNKRRVAEQKVIDSILDKISKSGYDSLSSREKEILFRNSNSKS
ncbi:MAG: rhomboid family intramembrane serine protease [Bacteroidales bacterium]|nr:rhomboid family intramembrane serine protease [Bacteroidales bacterium]